MKFLQGRWLFAIHGAPLVLKSDNGSPFTAGATLHLLAQFGVIPLFSPPYWPRYNGAIEAGIGSLKTRTDYQAARQGHPGYWTYHDVTTAVRGRGLAHAGGDDAPLRYSSSPEHESDTEVVVAANDTVYEAALFQLFRDSDRPYFFGIDDVCDASSENAEQFLQLAAVLVEAVATQIARNKSATLLPATQHQLLRERGARIIEWHTNSVSSVAFSRHGNP